MKSLHGHVAVVTGGSGGIGRAFARLARARGMRLCNWDIKVEPSDATYEASVACDVTDEASVAAATETTLKAFGRIDVLVNSVGITGPTATVDAFDPAGWRRVLEINLTGTFLPCRAVVPAMRARDYGRIVNVASIAGKEGNPNQSAYSASKAGVIGLTKSLGRELAGTGIRVNAVAPAITATDLVLQMTEAQRQLVLAKIPMGRPAEPEEVGEMILWLASPACSFATGAVFDVSGGRATY